MGEKVLAVLGGMYFDVFEDTIQFLRELCDSIDVLFVPSAVRFEDQVVVCWLLIQNGAQWRRHGPPRRNDENLRSLLSAGADVLLQECSSRAAFELSASFHEESPMERFLLVWDSRFEVNHGRNDAGDLPLHMAFTDANVSLTTSFRSLLTFDDARRYRLPAVGYSNCRMEAGATPIAKMRLAMYAGLAANGHLVTGFDYVSGSSLLELIRYIYLSFSGRVTLLGNVPFGISLAFVIPLN